MTNPPGPTTTVLTYSITAAQLYEMHGHLPIPLYVSENAPKRATSAAGSRHCRGKCRQ
jgi:hypothetical protein